MNIDPLNPPVIPVALAVTRCEPIPEDQSALIWGHVGDYEVRVCLPLNDPRVRGLLGEKGPGKGPRPRRSASQSTHTR